jgi:hypothetical protein
MFFLAAPESEYEAAARKLADRQGGLRQQGGIPADRIDDAGGQLHLPRHDAGNGRHGQSV